MTYVQYDNSLDVAKSLAIPETEVVRMIERGMVYGYRVNPDTEGPHKMWVRSDDVARLKERWAASGKARD